MNYDCKICRHLMPTGRKCKAPAMRNSAYCRHHRLDKSTRRFSHRSISPPRSNLSLMPTPSMASEPSSLPFVPIPYSLLLPICLKPPLSAILRC